MFEQESMVEIEADPCLTTPKWHTPELIKLSIDHTQSAGPGFFESDSGQFQSQ